MTPRQQPSNREAAGDPAGASGHISHGAGPGATSGFVTSPSRGSLLCGPWLSGGVGLGLVAAVLLAGGALLPAVEDGAPGFSSAALLVVLAVLPAAVAAGFALRGAQSTAAGVVAGYGALSLGRALVDLQLVVDSSSASRPELYLPTTLAAPGPAAGLWLLLAGHAVAIVAGAQAARLLSRRAEAAGAAGPETRRGPLLAVSAGLVAGIGLLMSPFGSEDAYLLARNAFESPALVLAGSLAVACALPLVVVVTFGSVLPETARGGLLGLAAGIVAIALPNVVAGLAVPATSVGGGPVTALIAAVALVALAVFRARDGAGPDDAPETDVAGAARLPGGRRLLAATGALALLTALFALGGAFGATVEAVGDAAATVSPARTWLLAAGVLVGLLGIALFVPGCAQAARPALAVAWVGVPLTGTGVLDTALTAGELPGGPAAGGGVLWTVLALVAAALTASCSVVAGMVEREDVDVDAAGTANGNLLAPLVAAGILAVAGLGLPAVAAPGYTAPGILSGFGTPSWGLLITLATVLGAAVLAPRARPARGASLLAGAALVLALRAAELPLGGDGIDGASAALGTWLALAAAIAFGVAAVLAVAGGRSATAGAVAARP